MSAWTKQFLTLLVSIFLVACGTDEGSGESEDGNDDPDTTEQVSLAVGTGSGDSFQAGQMRVGSKSLSAGGSTNLSFNIVNTGKGNEIYSGDPVAVSFASSCLLESSPKAELNGPLEIETGSGDVSVRYTAKGCEGKDTVTATASAVDGANASSEISFTTPEVSSTLDIAAPDNLKVSAATPSPQTLDTKGSGVSGNGQTAEVVFTVTAEGGAKVAREKVNFELIGADALSGDGAPSLESQQAETDSSGEAPALVAAGTGNAVVRVAASLADNPAIRTVSAPIAVSGGIPTQEGFSLSVSDALPPAAWNTDGVTSEITVRATDNYGNNSGNAVVNFVTSGGSIEGDCILDESGKCTVTWRSQRPRPGNGRVTIMARSLGEESFTDSDGNREYSQGEPYRNSRPEPYVDANQNGSWDNTEYFFDQDNDKTRSATGTTAYDGASCPAGESFCTQGPVPVWRAITDFWMTSDNLQVQLNGPNGGGDGEYCAAVSGQTGNGNSTPPPSGTTISFSFDSDGDGEITSKTTERTVSEDPRSTVAETFCVKAVGPGRLTVVADPQTGESAAETSRDL
ncbi:hypothetical protein [Salicola sp. Rm-C-2C1-2]|uniref:hypothetical protein n=1 Tax=Salicola sp. Rm-C-2C1-2 TaxID=3141321 RepID=UPI0032E51149